MKTIMTQKALYSIDDSVLNRFNQMVPERKRNQVVQDLLAQHIAAREAQIAEAVWLIENDPDYASIREISAESDCHAVETLARLDASE